MVILLTPVSIVTLIENLPSLAGVPTVSSELVETITVFSAYVLPLTSIVLLSTTSSSFGSVMVSASSSSFSSVSVLPPRFMGFSSFLFSSE